jgi:hypothetical protein
MPMRARKLLALGFVLAACGGRDDLDDIFIDGAGAFSGGGGTGAFSGGGGTATGGASTAGSGGIAVGGSAGAGAIAGNGGTAGAAGSGAVGGIAGAAGGSAGAAGASGGSIGLSMIDDFEDQNQFLLPIDGRSGQWSSFSDGTPGGELGFSILRAARPASNYALNLAGRGFTAWGAGVGFGLNRGGPYDASIYRGVTFWARIDSGSDTAVRLNVVDEHTTPEGGFCSACWDHFGRWIVLRQEWQRFVFRWDQLAQSGWGDLWSNVEPGAIYGMHFITRSNASFDVWIDDIAFFY